MRNIPANKKKQWLLLITVLLGVVATAQQKYEITAKEAVDLALKNMASVKNARIDYQLQESKNKEITGQAYPQISGTVQMNRFFAIPVTVLPDFISPSVYGVLQQEDVRDGSGNPITPPNSYQTFPARFGVPWTASAGFTVQQLLFQPDVFVGLKARSTAMEYAANGLKVAEDTLKQTVYASYYSVLIAEKALGFVNDGLKRLEKLHKDQTELFKNGFVERLDLDKTTVSINNLKTTQSQLEYIYKLGQAGLKLAIGVKQPDTLVLKDVLSMDAVKKDVLDNSSFKYEDRSEIQLFNSIQKLQQLDVKRNKLSYIPTVAAFWNYSQNAQRNKFNFFNGNEKWFPTSIVGLSLNVNIFDGFQRREKIRTATLNLEKTTNTIDQFKEVIDFQQTQTRMQMTHAITNLNIQEKNMELAESVFNTVKKKYEQGLGSSFEILQAEGELQQSQSSYFQAMYDAIVARIAYQRAIGKL
ncbi:MAG: hypothetical protein RLZZ316_1986 [Bacteroidota bacterium]